MSKHTPGPWRVESETDSHLGAVYRIHTCDKQGNGAWNRVATVVGNEANARLIAAAPTMKSLLYQMISALGEGASDLEEIVEDAMTLLNDIDKD